MRGSRLDQAKRASTAPLMLGHGNVGVSLGASQWDPATRGDLLRSAVGGHPFLDLQLLGWPELERHAQASKVQKLSSYLLGITRIAQNRPNRRCERVEVIDSKRGGEGGIRTLDRVSPIHAFQACAFNRSATSPVAMRADLFRIPCGFSAAATRRVPRAKAAGRTRTARMPRRTRYRSFHRIAGRARSGSPASRSA